MRSTGAFARHRRRTADADALADVGYFAGLRPIAASCRDFTLAHRDCRPALAEFHGRAIYSGAPPRYVCRLIRF